MFGCNPEIYDEPIALIREYLSADDIVDIEVGLSPHVKGSDRLYAVRNVAQDMRDMGGGRFGTLVHWRALGVDMLADTDIASFQIARSWEPTVLATETELLDAVEGLDQAQVDAWMALSPYLIWKIVNDVQEWVMEEVRDSLFLMARGTDMGERIARKTDERFRQAIEDWAKTALAA